MNQKQNESHQEYMDRQIRTLKNEVIAKDATIAAISDKNYKQEQLLMRDTKDHYIKLESLRRKNKSLTLWLYAKSIALIGLFLLFAFSTLDKNKEIISLKNNIKDKTWEYRPQSFQLKLADEYLRGDRLMLPGDTTVFVAPQSSYKLLIIKK